MTARGSIGLYGTGGCARGIMSLARRQYQGRALVFVEDSPQVERCNGHPVVSFDEFSREKSASIAIAIADPGIRKTLASKCRDSGLPFVGVASEDMIVMDDATWGEGCLFSPGVTLTCNIRIGDHFHCNLHSIVEHDCRIGDYVSFGPGVRCNGAVSIGDGAYIGAGAMIRQGITIGAGAVVGMGAVVVKDVAPGVTVVGNPAAPR